MNPTGTGFKVAEESGAAAWTTSEDVLLNDQHLSQMKTSPHMRKITGVIFVGGAAVNNTSLYVHIGDTTHIVTRNTATATLSLKDDMVDLDLDVPPSVPISATISAQSGTNPFTIGLRIASHPIEQVAAEIAMRQRAYSNSKRGRGY